MTWARPEAWWLLLVLLPLAASYLHHRRRRRSTVSGVFLWRELGSAGRGVRGLRSLRDGWQLLLLAAATILTVVALAEPGVRVPETEPARWTLVLDATTSMAARDAGTDGRTSRLAVARSLLPRVLARASAADETLLWVVGSRPELRVLPAPVEEAAFDQLDDLGQAPAEGSLRRAVKLALSERDGLDVPEERHLVVLTDADGVERLTGLPTDGASVSVVRVGPALPSNAAVTVEREREGELEVRVRATDGAPGARRVLVTFRPELGAARRLTEQLVEPRGGADEVLTLPAPTEPGVVWAELQPSDSFTEDDADALALADRRPVAVVLVAAEGASPFLVEALRAMPDVVDPARARLAGSEVPRAVLDAADLVVVDGTPPAYVPADLPRLDFRARGGEEVVDPLLWSVGTHPVLEGVDLSPLRLERAVLLVPAEDEQPLIATAEGTVATVGRGTEGGARRIRLGFRPDATTLPLEAAYPVLLRNAVEWLVQRPPAVERLRSGEPLWAVADRSGDLEAVRFVVRGAEPRLLESGGERLPLVPEKPFGGPLDVGLGPPGREVPSVWTWAPPADFSLGRDTTPDRHAPDRVLEALPDRSGPRRTSREYGHWAALAAAALLVVGALLGRRPDAPRTE